MNDSVDLSKVIVKTNAEMERLGWTLERGREHLIQTYGKRGLTLLSEDELLDFLRYLEYLPTPESKLDNPIKNSITSGKTTNKTTKTSKIKSKEKPETVDLSEIIAKTDIEMERLGWTPQQGREHLIQTYGKRGRTLLTEEELLGFLQYLESLPTETEILETDPFAGF